MEYTRKIVRNPRFIVDLRQKILTAVDLTEIENDLKSYKRHLSNLQHNRACLESDIDRIVADDKYADRRRADMARRLDDLYEEIYKTEDSIQDCIMKKETLESEKISMQSILEILSSFDVIYDKMNATERRDLIKYLIVDVQLFNKAEQKVEKRFVKEITYKFPIEQEILAQFSDKEVSVESIALLARPAW